MNILSDPRSVEWNGVKERNRRYRSASRLLVKFGWIPAIVVGTFKYGVADNSKLLTFAEWTGGGIAVIILILIVLHLLIRKIPVEGDLGNWR